MAGFEFPRDSRKVAGAVKLTNDESSFFVPAVLHGADGMTAISAENPLPTSFLVMPSNAAFGGSGSMTKTYDRSMFAFGIKNKHTAPLTFVINGNSIDVDAGEGFNQNFDPFTTVTITASGPFKAFALTYPNFDGVIIPEQPTPDTTPPNDVTGLSVSNLASTSLTLSWSASSSPDVTGYNVYNGATLLGFASGLTYPVSGLTAQTAYTFYVKAKDAAGNLSAGASVQTTTTAIPSDTTAPNNVTSVAQSNVTSTGATITWSASSSGDTTGYDVYNGTTFLQTVTGLTYNATGLTASTQYTFTIKARDGAGNVASGASVTFTTSAAADTTPPVLTISPAAGTYTTVQSVTMSATDNSGGAVTIYYTTDGSTPTTSSSVYSSAISINSTTTVKAFAKDAAGNSSAVQSVAYTINLSDTTPPSAVTGLTVSSTNSNAMTVGWTPSASGDVASVEVAYSTDGTNFTVSSSAVSASATSYTVSGLSANTSYTIRVIAVDTSGNRSAAATTTGTTAAAAGKVSDASLLYYVDNPTNGTAVPTPTNYFTGSNQFTFEVTFQPVAQGANAANMLGTRYTSGATDNAFKLEFTWDNHISAALYGTNPTTSAAAYPQVSPATAFTDYTKSYHIQVRWDGVNLEMYIDNVKVGSTALGTSTFAFNVSAQTFYIGQPSRTGIFKNAAYYNRALTSAELTQNYNALK